MRALDVVDLGPFIRDNRDKPEGATFPAARTPAYELTSLDQLARNWLTYWLLEIGTRDFESWLAGVSLFILRLPRGSAVRGWLWRAGRRARGSSGACGGCASS